MKSGGSKSKGSAFEREICVKLSLWISAGAHKDLFWRSAMSGGRATAQLRKGINIRQIGDIAAVALQGHVLTDTFYIECKFYKNLQIESFLIKNKGNLAKFWTTAVKQARRYKRLPMLIIKQNNSPIMVLTIKGSKILGKQNIPIMSSNTQYCDLTLLDILTTIKV